MEEFIEAKLLFRIYHNSSNYYSVLKVRTLDDDVVMVTGYFKDLNDETIYKMYGSYNEHPKYGIQFNCTHYESSVEKSTKGLIKYLSSDAFPGIGKACAKKIIDLFGIYFEDLLKDNPNILDQCDFLTAKKKKVLIDGIINRSEDDLSLFIARYGINVRYMKQIDNLYHNHAVEKIKDNPYELMEKINGIGFESCDKIAKQFAVEASSPKRIRAFMLASVTNLCFKDGDTYILKDELYTYMEKHFVGIDFDEYLFGLIDDCLLYEVDGRIYHHQMYESEIGIASFIKGFPFTYQEEFDNSNLENDIESLENNNHIKYDDIQKNAIKTFFDEDISIITGGPGSGKTTIVSAILSLYQKYYPQGKVALCAPTGRASKRLSELSNYPSSTIHSLLHYDLELNEFSKNKKDPLDVDCLIIDEFSMCDQWLFYNLLQASHAVSKILIIGDEDQLPSVGSGNVLHDLIASNKITCCALHKVYRQSEGSGVISLANDIKYETCDDLNYDNGVLFLECNEDEIRDKICLLVQEALAKGYDNQDIQVLAPMYRGKVGIDNLNYSLQQILNPYQENKEQIIQGSRIFRVGDKVLQLRNQSEDDVYNGDIGIIEDIEIMNKEYRILVKFQERECEYTKESIMQLTHAFAVSVHKAQGCEFSIVMMPIANSHSYMLDKRLIYTGITRAKRSLVLIGNKNLFVHAIKRKDKKERRSTLINRLSLV